jgi:hypothetical protein
MKQKKYRWLGWHEEKQQSWNWLEEIYKSARVNRRTAELGLALWRNILASVGMKENK